MVLAGLGCLLTGYVLLGCGGSGGSSGGNFISGDINVANYVIPAGKTVTARGKLTLKATDQVQIDGTLLIDPTADVVIESPKITGSGTIGPGVEALRRDKSSSQRSNKARNADGCGNPKPLVLITDEVSTEQVGNPNGDVYVVSFTTGPMLISNYVFSGRGKSSFETGLKDGCAGHDIEIGTAKARDYLSSRAPGSGRATSSLDLRERLVAGLGGEGKIDFGSGTTEKWTAASGNGGKGGSITVTASGTVALTDRGRITAGDGGIGGQISIVTKSGTTGQKGQSLSATTGNGGRGGDAVVLAGALIDPDKRVLSGVGGMAGSASVVIGNGGAAAAGGDLTLVVGDFGEYGKGRTSGRDVVAVASVKGGNGGDSDEPLLAGGAGGKMVVMSPSGGMADIKQLLIEDAFNGGKGYEGCTKTPIRVGSKGGAAGTLVRQKCPDLAKYPTGEFRHKASFNGGDGGDGSTPGAGGKGGSDDTPIAIGVDGKSGKGCPGAVFDQPTFYPAPTGRKWTYHYVFGSGSTLDFDTIVGSAETIPGTSLTGTPFKGIVGGVVSNTNYSVVNSTAGVQSYVTDYFSGTTRILRLVTEPPETIPQGLGVGESWERDITRTRTDAGGTSSQTYHLKVTLAGFESVAIGSTNYPGCAKVTFTYSVTAGSNTVTKWFAPGIGLVKYSDASSGDLQTLTSYSP